jgi:hypothetical protein
MLVLQKPTKKNINAEGAEETRRSRRLGGKSRRVRSFVSLRVMRLYETQGNDAASLPGT